MVENNIKKIVFLTAATYGEPKNIPILETDPTEPTNPYGETKNWQWKKCLNGLLMLMVLNTFL